MSHRTIVISAVNLRKGGTLTILRDCLQYLSRLAKSGNWRVVALVHKRDLCDYEGIEYIEMPDIIKNWGRRLWCEYVTMHKVSKELAPVYLWLSLHDTSPRVEAERRAVYCHNPFPFYDWKWRELFFDYKIVLFSCFSYFIYRINIHKNHKIIVQQQWIKKEFESLFSLSSGKIIVAPPEKGHQQILSLVCNKERSCTFLFPSSSNLHKNFETLCEAARLLEAEVGKDKFKVVLTLNGTENRYARWLYSNWSGVTSIEFAGFMSKERLYGCYRSADCLVFPSKVETWGLPISEFMEASGDKPMILSDLPYAHETASGASQVCFFNPSNPDELKRRMKEVMCKEYDAFEAVPKVEIEAPKAYAWDELFDILLN